MSHLKFFKDISKNDVAIAGGKGASLGEMTKVKISVPPGFVVLASAFDRFIEETNLKEEIKARLDEVVPRIPTPWIKPVMFCVIQSTTPHAQGFTERNFGVI